MRTFYPVMLDLTGKSCLVVGGGEVAARKIESLLQAGAAVTVISPEVVESVKEWAEAGRLAWRKERYQEQDVRGFALVVAATNQAEVNLAVYQAVKAADGWINIVDRPDLCNYIVPSVIQRGNLVISVSTSGASPSLAKKIKQRIEREIGPEYESYLEFLAEMRQQVLKQVADPKQRKELFQLLLDDAYVSADDEERYKMAAILLQETKERGIAGRHS
jgi:precorrin-2 dehydrogenase/sirohydrochlorin ferrochelatase